MQGIGEVVILIIGGCIFLRQCTMVSC